MSIVQKFVALHDLLEAINIDYQLKYEHATTRRQTRLTSGPRLEYTVTLRVRREWYCR